MYNFFTKIFKRKFQNIHPRKSKIKTSKETYEDNLLWMREQAIRMNAFTILSENTCCERPEYWYENHPINRRWNWDNYVVFDNSLLWKVKCKTPINYYDTRSLPNFKYWTSYIWFSFHRDYYDVLVWIDKTISDIIISEAKRDTDEILLKKQEEEDIIYNKKNKALIKTKPLDEDLQKAINDWKRLMDIYSKIKEYNKEILAIRNRKY